MHPRIEEVLSYLDTERTALRAAVELVPAPLRNQPPAADRWSVAQVLQHLASVENKIGMAMTKWIADARAAETGPETETSPVVNNLMVQAIADRSKRRDAPEEFRPPGDVDAESAWAALERSRKTLRDALLAGDGLALGEIKQPHPVLGPIDLYQWALFEGSHEARHAGQIREIATQMNADSTTTASAS